MLANAHCRAGDLVLTASTSLLGKLIRWAQRTGSEGPSRTNHSAGVVADGWVYPDTGPDTGDPRLTEIVESDLRVRRGTLWKYHARDQIWVFRPLNIPDWQLQAIVRGWESKLGRPYSFLQLPAQLLDHKLFGGRVVTRWLFKFSPLDVCSRLVVEEMGKHGYHFGVRDFSATPDDIWDFCLANKDKYSMVYGE